MGKGESVCVCVCVFNKYSSRTTCKIKALYQHEQNCAINLPIVQSEVYSTYRDLFNNTTYRFRCLYFYRECQEALPNPQHM